MRDDRVLVAAAFVVAAVLEVPVAAPPQPRAAPRGRRVAQHAEGERRRARAAHAAPARSARAASGATASGGSRGLALEERRERERTRAARASMRARAACRRGARRARGEVEQRAVGVGVGGGQLGADERGLVEPVAQPRAARVGEHDAEPRLREQRDELRLEQHDVVRERARPPRPRRARRRPRRERAAARASAPTSTSRARAAGAASRIDAQVERGLRVGAARDAQHDAGARVRARPPRASRAR